MSEAMKHLRENQRQLDMDGCEVGISRQALDELLYVYEAQAAQIAESESKVTNWRTCFERMQQRRIDTQIDLDRANAQIAVQHRLIVLTLHKLNCETVDEFWALQERRRREFETTLAAANARIERMREALRKSEEGWANVIAFRLIPSQHVGTAETLRDECRASLAEQESGE